MPPQNSLKRTVGLPGAIMMGMGSIVGTGVFISLGLAADIVGPYMILALFSAGFLAICNGLSTAQLAAEHPASGGTYEYGYRHINEWTGFSAGWLFLCAKSASAATAAIGFGGYFNRFFKIESYDPWQIGFFATVILILLTAGGIKRSSLANTIIVSITLVTLIAYIFISASYVNFENFSFDPEIYSKHNNILPSFFEATALMFVAYTGYGRVATLGEEIVNPTKNIPKAIVATLGLSFLIYLSVAFVSIGTVGSSSYAAFTTEGFAPLKQIADSLGHPVIARVLSVGAMTAMLGVILNLILGLSRVVFAMGRKKDLPKWFSNISPKSSSPKNSVYTSGCIILALILLKDIKIAWSLSALTVLLYYSITNLSALRLPSEKRLYPRAFAYLGFAGCLSLGFWVEESAVIIGFLVLGTGIGLRFLFRRL